MGAELISERLKPVQDEPSPLPWTPGSPVLPGAFKWRGQTHRVTDVLGTGKRLGPCTHGSNERYLRKHTYRLRMDDGSVWDCSFDRQPPRGGKPTARWWLTTREPDDYANSGND